MKTSLDYANKVITGVYGAEPIEFEPCYETYRAYGQRLSPHIADVQEIVLDAHKRGEYVLLEGAQGSLLDLDHGTYPYVTSSHPIAGGACIGTGIGPKDIDTVIGICKAYTTRVGAGSFPTEQENETGHRIRERGHEYGTTTGRPRRVGWLDVVGLRYATRVNGLDWLAVTLLDVLSGFPEVKICTAYQLNGDLLQELPADRKILSQVTPVYETIPGWEEEISNIDRFEKLPHNAQAYVRRVEELLDVPAALVSVGRRREETIILEPSLFEEERVIGARRAG
jgi:adenylosuccinate synthase